MEMCRFAGSEDPEYRKVASALQRMAAAKPAGQTRPRRVAAVNDTSRADKQAQMLRECLVFDQIDSRQMTIKKAHAKTCKWLLKTTEYLEWLNGKSFEDHRGFFWIKGKPGTGKSTLMKYSFVHTYRAMSNSLVISFFFNARGETLEKSTVGMFRSLVLQLLDRVPEVQAGLNILELTTTLGSYKWSIEALKELFGHTIQMAKQRPIICFIDALDECDELEVRDLVSYFEYLGELCVSVGVRFRVCFSSRHYPHITLSHGLELVLEGHEGHSEDIASYLNTELRIGDTQLAAEIRESIREKSSGVFMWVVLVVGILNKEYDDGNMHTLRQKLRDIPAQLHELFRDILTRRRGTTATGFFSAYNGSCSLGSLYDPNSSTSPYSPRSSPTSSEVGPRRKFPSA